MNIKYFTIVLITLLFQLFAVTAFSSDSEVGWNELNDELTLSYKDGHYVRALELAKNKLEYAENNFERDSPYIFISLCHLGASYYKLGKYTDSESIYKRALSMAEEVIGPDNTSVALVLHSLATLYNDQAKYEQSEPLYKRALAIREKKLGNDHPDVAETLNGLGCLYEAQAQYAIGEPLFKRALAIREKTLGPDHTGVAEILNNLASLYQAKGQYTQVESLLKRALAIKEKSLGLEHPDVAPIHNNLAELYRNLGQNALAEPHYKRALEVWEKTLGSNHPDVASGLNNLAALYDATNAEPLYKRALSIRENALGSEHPDVAISITFLAALYLRQAKHAQAEPLYERALAIRVKALGPDHPDVATSLTGLAELYEAKSQYTKAEPLYNRALAILEKTLGPNHPKVATAVRNLAIFYAAFNQHDKSHYYFQRQVLIDETTRENIFQVLSEKQKFNFIKNKENEVYSFMSHTVQYMASSSSAVTDTFNTWLHWKGTVTESQSRYQESAGGSLDPAVKYKYEELNSIRRKLGQLQLAKPDKLSITDYRTSLNSLENTKELIEAELSGMSTDFALEKNVGQVDTIKLLSSLPPNAVYIDFAKIKTCNFKNHSCDKESYYAFVLNLTNSPDVKLIEVADAEVLDNLLKFFMQEMKGVDNQGLIPDGGKIGKSARALHDMLMKSLEKHIVGRQHVIISPDGNLSLLPFEILMAPDGKSLIDKYAITYVGAGRDILRFADTAITQATALIMADPDFNMGLNEKNRMTAQLKLGNVTRGKVSQDSAKLYFTPLPDTKVEADAIAKVLTEKMHMQVRNFQNKSALEEVLFATEPPRVLHLATHGYFLDNEKVVSNTNQTRGLVINKKDGLIFDDNVVIENPMLRSGIVLSGANTALRDGRDDGVITAEKILGLRLKGTDLVVLSACETGVGDVKNGEGVMGLKRAFHLSGAKSLVMSLWSVPSAETTELMSDFYTLMAEGKNKSDALRQAKLNMMNKKANPFYWGAFILTGKPD